jgi:alkylation response protein AidB-like acyl-CoA dehydrogenase
MGFMGIEVPEQYGGAGMDTLAYVLALEEICKADASHGTIMSVNNSLYANGLMRFGTEEQKLKYLRPVASGKAVGAYSLTEPMSGSDAGTMRSRACAWRRIYHQRAQILGHQRPWPIICALHHDRPRQGASGHFRLYD